MTVSDRDVKEAFCEELRNQGFRGSQCSDCKIGGDGYDVVARCGDTQYFFEIKSSSKDGGEFFGTVMLTELYKAIQNTDNYFFVVARKDMHEWVFEVFTPEQFMQFCTLTTPIFLYRIKENEIQQKQPKSRKYRSRTVRANKGVIQKMWSFFEEIRDEFGENQGDPPQTDENIYCLGFLFNRVNQHFLAEI